jgi:regulatory protein
MSFQDQPREPRRPRKPRARISLKMQAIGFLSRREHSRQELRAKLLDALRKQAREQAAQALAAEKTARALADALREQPSNGIDDAFAPSAPMPVAASAHAQTPARAHAPAPAAREDARARRAHAPVAPACAGARATGAASLSAQDGAASPRTSMLDRPALDTLSLANGAPLPSALRASLAATTAPAPSPPRWPPPSATPVLTRRSAEAARRDPATAAFDDADADRFDPFHDAPPDPPAAPLDATDLELADPEAAVDQLLDWLVANKYLSETRFVESRVNARSRKQGGLLIKLELARHGLALEPEQAATLRETEFARAQALWQRKFGEPATDPKLRAKQARFLAARGFAADVVRRVVGGEEEF